MKLPTALTLLLCLFLTKARGKTLRECASCFGDLVTCVFDDKNDCKIFDCNFKDDDYGSCGCQECVEEAAGCFNQCIPDCLESSIKAHFQCLIDPSNNCFNNCVGIQGVGGAVRFPLPDAPEDCQLFRDWTTCLPQWPQCDAVQNTAVGDLCRSRCCPNCDQTYIDVQNCAYNWITGYDCQFMCPRRRSLRTAEDALRKLNNDSRATAPDDEVQLEFLDECRQVLVRDVIFKPNTAYKDFMDCIMTGSIEVATDESNKPEQAEVEENGGTGAEGNGEMGENEETGTEDNGETEESGDTGAEENGETDENRGTGAEADGETELNGGTGFEENVEAEDNGGTGAENNGQADENGGTEAEDNLGTEENGGTGGADDGTDGSEPGNRNTTSGVKKLPLLALPISFLVAMCMN